ncbi:hypothetical protein D1J63_08585 [Streptomyces sp. KPB2]|jgi:hypothetical protein|nr:hypothetical protein D1J63_08585 [Streptomyces sp. KPB2]GHE85210.1 hypothetical protein GCM10018789_11600 [Streptomyces werraensis]
MTSACAGLSFPHLLMLQRATPVWPGEAETHLEHFAIKRKTVTGLVDRLPASPRSYPSTRTARL